MEHAKLEKGANDKSLLCGINAYHAAIETDGVSSSLWVDFSKAQTSSNCNGLVTNNEIDEIWRGKTAAGWHEVLFRGNNYQSSDWDYKTPLNNNVLNYILRTALFFVPLQKGRMLRWIKTRFAEVQHTTAQRASKRNVR